LKKGEEIKRKLPRGYVWGKQWAIRESGKRRARGGMLMGIKKEMEKGKGVKIMREGMEVVGRVKMGKQRWRIMGVYINGNISEMLKELEEGMEEKEKGFFTLIGGILMLERGKKEEVWKRKEMEVERKRTGEKEELITGE